VRSLLRSLVLLFIATAVAAGCSAGRKDIPEVRSCLKDAGMEVSKFPKKEKSVEEGVFATTDLSKGDQARLTLAVAAYVKSEKTVDKFQKDVKDFSKALSVGKQKLVIDSGTDGKYVWVVTGASEDKVYKDALACVD
jgi:hypothetical protein